VSPREIIELAIYRNQHVHPSELALLIIVALEAQSYKITWEKTI